jgi:hypothetical protein
MSMKSDVHPARFRHIVDVGPRTTHNVLEVAFAEVTCSTGASSTYTYQQLASGSVDSFVYGPNN